MQVLISIFEFTSVRQFQKFCESFPGLEAIAGVSSVLDIVDVGRKNDNKLRRMSVLCTIEIHTPTIKC